MFAVVVSNSCPALTMRRASLLLTCMACAGFGWCAQTSADRSHRLNGSTSVDSLGAFATLLIALNPRSAFLSHGVHFPISNSERAAIGPAAHDALDRVGQRIPVIAMREVLASPDTVKDEAATSKAALRALFEPSEVDEVLACPLPDKVPLRTERVVIGGLPRTRKISAAGVRYPVNSLYTDLVPTVGRSSPLSFNELVEQLQDAWGSRVQTGLFRQPYVSFLYERGWRENFKNAGFPGIEKEFAEVSDFFAPVATDGVVVDMSCGSGLMTRRLVRSGAYRRVIALDYSESMLTETARRVREESVPRQETLTLCRADVAALPLRPGSVDAMHAGAAMHCWPKLEEGLREIHAAIKPGGRFFATTFIQGAYGVPMPQQTGGGSFRFFASEAELKQLVVDAGFLPDDVVVRREGRGCAIIRAEKAK